MTILSQLSHFFSPLYSPLYSPTPTLPPSFPQLGSCPCVIHISSLASPFPILFLTCLFCTYNLCFLFLVHFPPFSSLHLPTDNPPCDLNFCDSVPVLLVCPGYIYILPICVCVHMCICVYICVCRLYVCASICVCICVCCLRVCV